MLVLEEGTGMTEQIPQYLVVCCWRSIKEVSLLLGHVTLSAPIKCSDEDDDEEQGALLTFEQVHD